MNEVFEAEQQLVGLILGEPAVYGRIAAILCEDDWSERLHRGVFEVRGWLVMEGQPVVLEAVLPRVSDVAPDGKPADLYLASLAAKAPSSNLAEPLARLLVEATHARIGPDHLDTEKRSRSWTISIRVKRLDAELLLERSPSLKHRLPGAIRDAYRRARIEAAGETGLDDDHFPADCPYGFEEIMARPVPWPAEDDKS